MDASAIGNLIATLGFPIVAAGALFWYMYKQGENHKEETTPNNDKNSQSVENNKESFNVYKSQMSVIWHLRFFILSVLFALIQHLKYNTKVTILMEYIDGREDYKEF